MHHARTVDTAPTKLGLLHIQEADPSQAGIVTALLQEAAGWMSEQQIKQWDRSLFTEQLISEYFANRKVYIAYLNDEPAGMFTLQEDDSAYWKDRNDSSFGYLHRLTVRRCYSGAGIGERLLRAAENIASDAGKKGLRLDCRADNPKLNTVYQKQGFRFMGISDMGEYHVNLYEKQPRQETDSDVRLVYMLDEDLPLMQQWASSAEFQLQWSGSTWEHPLQLAMLKQYMEDANNSAASGKLVYKVLHGLSGDVIGTISIGLDRRNLSGRVGKVVIGHPEYRGRGCGTRLIEEALRIGFAGLQLHRITLAVFDFNESAIRAYERAGFQREGLMRECAKIGESYWSTIEMGILRREWEQRITAQR
ncbi:GNAT family N-acetyltransferase [Paenibacillus sp. P96]|uniref:GNAT family N-acetyltransferase n=1 Tax=Paenibacillus zeirhizosphaerae TaxID=2987519 RepID=A0ABT9FV98_9BACL|nr:GNAT family N-acetyltransferase [Paenibacillus sp. P96]MDP4098656.1 GNAT family N-acetyltransferase [Paenibacillus sp. P96]